MSIWAAGSAFPIIAARTPTPTTPSATREVVRRRFAALGCKLIFEPGRLIVGNAGILVTRVLYVKQGEDKTFVIVDAGMNDLIRPTLYDAFHEIVPVTQDAHRAANTSPTLSGRSARPATISRMGAQYAAAASPAISSPC